MGPKQRKTDYKKVVNIIINDKNWNDKQRNVGKEEYLYTQKCQVIKRGYNWSVQVTKYKV